MYASIHFIGGLTKKSLQNYINLINNYKTKLYFKTERSSLLFFHSLKNFSYNRKNFIISRFLKEKAFPFQPGCHYRQLLGSCFRLFDSQ